MMYIGRVESDREQQSGQSDGQQSEGGVPASESRSGRPVRAGSTGKFLPGLRREREEKMWAQEKLEEATGVTQATISALELQKRTAHWSTIHKLASGLGVKPKDLMR